ncbi:hypothetical protein RJ640_006555 [Escallonia rubra]|uniref:Uncharacterized protein n=1 Tax=Escallonia rubra TaxID=112253 RepID=A0AA88UCC5_9ASTE|nr:hypothetical protein RJ640_006555 [Escallonia rubra]
MHRTLVQLTKICQSIERSYNNCNFHYHVYSLQPFTTSSSMNFSIKRDPYQNVQHNPISVTVHYLSYVIEESLDTGDPRAGLSVHTHLTKLYFNGYTSLWNKLLNLYCKCGQLAYAWKVFETMPERNVVSFNTMVLGCIRNGYALQALSLYTEMGREKNVSPNHITLAGLIGACDGVLVTSLHAQAFRYGWCCNEYVGSSLVDVYTKEMHLEDAVRAFHEIAELDLVSWNIMIDGCVRNGSKERALKMFARMIQEKVEFDGFTLTSVVKTCLESRNLDLGMLVHGSALKVGLSSGTPISNALITMYSKCEMGMTSAKKIFEGILAPNIISWTAIIAGFMQNGQNEEAIGLYRSMLRAGMQENDFTFASILPAYSNMANLEQGRQIHARIAKSWFGLDLSVNNALLDMYSKCGDLDEAHLVFWTMGNHDKVSCTTMITGLGQHGKGREALEILKEMESEGLKPDDVTFLASLSACSHGGLVNEGIWLIKTMVDVYDLKPRREHLSCAVDMLGRAGRLNEAESFIKDMGMESDVFAWEALLGACRLHGETALGEKSAKMIVDVQPEGHVPYVLLANIYAEQELWEDKGVVRENLVVSGSKEVCGCTTKESDVFAWEALLGACGLHGETALGEKSAKMIVDVQPRGHVPYVLLANIYAEKELWEDKRVVRENLVVSGSRRSAVVEQWKILVEVNSGVMYVGSVMVHQAELRIVTLQSFSSMMD